MPRRKRPNPKPKPVKSWYQQQRQSRRSSSIETINGVYGCVIKSWIPYSRHCTTTSSLLPTLVQIDSRSKYSLEASTLCPGLVKVRAWLKVTGDCAPAFTYSTIDESKPFDLRARPEWIEENCHLKEPYYSSRDMRFCNLFGLEGRFYAMSEQGSVVVIERVLVDKEKDKGFRFGITRVGGNRAVPSGPSRHFREYMFESGGKIMVVLLVSRDSIGVVDDVEVFRLDVERLRWVKVEKIGGRALILSERRCMWAKVCEEEEDFKRDRVYFTHKWCDGNWMVFDMETGKVSKVSNECGEGNQLPNLYLG